MEFGYTPVKHHNAHGEFYKYIESFPDQRKIEEGPGHLPQHQVTLDHLRQELIDITKNPKYYENKMCYRTCFKWGEREYVQYCLNQKCGGADFNSAAKVMGYLK